RTTLDASLSHFKEWRHRSSERTACAMQESLLKRDTAMTLPADPAPERVMSVFESGDLEVLAFRLDVRLDRIHDFGACLTEDERRRAHDLVRERDRSRFVVTRGQLR